MLWHPGTPYAVVGGMIQWDGQPTLDVYAHPQVWLLPFCREAAGYACKRMLGLHAEEAIHKNDKGGELTTLLDTGLQILLLLVFLCCLQTLVW